MQMLLKKQKQKRSNMEITVVDEFFNTEKFETVKEQTLEVVDAAIKYVLKDEYSDDIELAIIFVTDEKIKELNKSYRNKDYVTDVISFELEEELIDFNFEPIRNLGDIFISIPQMKRQAKEYGHSETRELSFLVVHGVLHLLGFDHIEKEDEVKMFKLQDEILDCLSIKR